MKFVFNPDAEYIWQSNKGIKYVTEDIKVKKTIKTTAVLQRIPHTNVENDTVCLKIGRYKFAHLENEAPKSELTLDGDEFENLIKFVEKFIGPLKSGADTFISLDRTDASKLLNEFKEIAKNDSERAKLLLESGLYNDDLSIVIENLKRKESLNCFCKMLSEDLDESSWQQFFQNNQWILGSDYLKIIKERRIDNKNIADYIMESNDGFVDIVEIKKPSLNFWGTIDHDNYVPSSELIKAITQCENYIYEIEREMNSCKYAELIENTPIASPKCLLIFGRSKDWNTKQHLAYRLLNASLTKVVVITYDELHKRAQNTIGLNEDSN